MRILTPVQATCAAAALALMSACSGSDSSAIVPKPASPQAGARFAIGHHIVGHYSCPLLGPIKYLSDPVRSVIDVYVGKFAGQAPCGQITSGLNRPLGLYVQPVTHDLYVANQGAFNVLVFHRDQTTPYNTYIDPSDQLPIDVTVAKDGTVIASNEANANNVQPGSISTWFGGPHGGVWTGNFTMVNGGVGEFITIQKNGTIYFEVSDPNVARSTLWSVKCPDGACGAQSKVAGAIFHSGGGLASDSTDDVISADAGPPVVDTFELPNPRPSAFPLLPFALPAGIALSQSDHKLYVIEGFNNGPNGAYEYSYPSGVLIGSVPCCAPYSPFGIAVDPGHAP